MEIHRYDTVHQLCEEFTDFMLELLKSKQTISICLSGGSTPKTLFSYWASESKNRIPWQNLFFYWGDERCVPPTDEMSNYGMTKKHLFDKVVIPQDNIFRIQGEDDPAAEAKRYARVLPPKFDLMILGMGEDGHTASIFPHEMHLWDSPENCVVATHPDTGMKRVSVTGKVINASEHVCFLTTGAGKAGKLQEIITNQDKAAKVYPAARVAPVSGNLHWFVDQEAASKL